MTDPAEKRRLPRLNHVAMSMPADLLAEDERKQIVAFYNDVFGWEEYEMLTEDRRRLVMRVHTNEQFVFLIADEDPMTTQRMDHFGMSVGTKDEFDELWEKVAARAANDSDVDTIEPHFDDYLIFEGISVDEHSGKQHYLYAHVACRRACLNAIDRDPQDCRRHAETFTWEACAAQFLAALKPIPGSVWQPLKGRAVPEAAAC